MTTTKRVAHAWDESVSGMEAFSVSAPKVSAALDFTPQPMVGWYSPGELITAGIRAVVSSTFGSYADKREIESVLAQGEWQDYSEYFARNGEIWLDYVADLGDGWDPTYTIARLLAEPQLAFDDGATVTQRGHVLVMGGDQVYPTASEEEYANRLVGPYRSALPSVDFDQQAPHLFMIPGNHDWYDGLESFFKLFCQKRWVGGWRMQQTRSYFACKIDQRLWLWGIDIQLKANIDQPQLDYFDDVAKEMAPGSDIILCTAEPSWVYAESDARQQKDPVLREKIKEETYHNLGHLQEKVVHKHGHRIIVGLAGDAHNYTRYEGVDADRQQMIVSGGGGASLYPTHDMPVELELPQRYGAKKYQRQHTFPEVDESRREASKSIGFPFFPLNRGFAAFLGSFYLLLAWVIQSVSKVAAGGTPGASLLERFNLSFDVGEFLRVIAHSPGSVTFLLLLTVGLILFSGYRSWLKKAAHGLLHSLAHIGLFLLLLFAFSRFNLGLLGLHVDDVRQVLLFGAEMLLFGGTLGSIVFGLYLFVSNRWLHLHDDEILLCQSSPHFKNFLRLHIKADGSITIYPVGVRRCPRKWNFQPDAANGAAWFEPAGAPIEDSADLIEESFSISFRRESATPYRGE